MNDLKVLVVDDESRMRKLVRDFLVKDGYSVVEAADGEEAVDVFMSDKDISLIILDVMMPKLDGIRATLKIREENPLPIIILSAKSEDADKILGLNVGADDYVTKPFNPLELVARVKSQLRRYTRLGAAIPVENAHIYETGGLSINDDLKEVRVDGDVVKLTPIEYNILLLLMKNPREGYFPLIRFTKTSGMRKQLLQIIRWQCISGISEKKLRLIQESQDT